MPSAFDALLATAGARFEALDTDAPATARDAAACPAALLGHLAWSRGLDHWSSDWSEATRRELVRQTPSVVRRRGTRAAIDAVAAVFGSQVDVEEWWETTPRGTPGTARASVAFESRVATTPEAQDELRVLLVREGRASVHWTLRLEGMAAVRMGTRSKLRSNLLLQTTGVQLGA